MSVHLQMIILHIWRKWHRAEMRLRWDAVKIKWESEFMQILKHHIIVFVKQKIKADVISQVKLQLNEVLDKALTDSKQNTLSNTDGKGNSNRWEFLWCHVLFSLSSVSGWAEDVLMDIFWFSGTTRSKGRCLWPDGLC